MKKIFLKTIFASAIFSTSIFSYAQDLTRDQVIGAMEKSAAYHMIDMKVTAGAGKAWDLTELPTREWHTAAYYDGMIALSKVSGNSIYLAEVLRHGNSVGWTPARRKYHADDHAVGHAWLDCYVADKSKTQRLEPFKKLFEAVVEDAANWKDEKSKGDKSALRSWDWCDALFMAPPTLARLYVITKDKRFLDYMNSEYKWCYDTLYSKEDDLFYRDIRYIGQKSPNGHKIFWSRGDGWVVGGLAQIISTLPKDEPSRKFYEDLFVAMMTKIATLQGDDGLWTVNLVDKDHFKGGETSGSGFFTFALAWGINNGYLNKEKYLPQVVKGWKGLLTRVKDSGMVGYVQPVGASPDAFGPDSTHAYGVGVFLLAGSEIAKLLGMDAKISDEELMGKAEAIYSAKTPRAYAHIEPRRKDDIAWENDKMAFRAYGPALKDSIENSGIDVWTKSVPYSVIDKWYDDDLAGKQSYHKDNGEGLDDFKVADSVGLGGTGIWKNGKLYRSNVYVYADVIWKTSDNLEIYLVYSYDIDGQKITEVKKITLAVGDSVCKVTSRFIKREFEPRMTLQSIWSSKGVMKNLEVAAGILAQSPDAVVETGNGKISIKDSVAKKPFNSFLRVLKGFERFERVPFGKTQEVLAIAKTDEKGELSYEFGYVWAGYGKK